MEQYTPYFGKQALSIKESSHDTFDETKFKNWLSNGAGIGVYAHGRVHQEVGNTVFVSDLIHKRGHLMTSDILLMEEQDLLSMGEPLSVSSRMGDLVCMKVLPTMNTANGEGSLIAYYRRGVVAFDTFEAPRETRVDGDGIVIQKGWDYKRLINHLLNTISAVGRYAVTALTRDHMFRSTQGLHFLKTVTGEGSFSTEAINRISTDVDPLLRMDSPEDLSGAATGYWIAGDRLFATTGMVRDEHISSDSFGTGFVSLNQAYTFTEDRTPIAVWEGLWTMDSEMRAVHKFSHLDTFNFVCSDADGVLYAAEIGDCGHDTRCGVSYPIEWCFETGQVAPSGLDKKSAIRDGVIELQVDDALSTVVRVYARTDTSPQWQLWKTIKPHEGLVGRILMAESLGMPPKGQRDCTWIQLRVEGSGYVEVRLIDLDFGVSTVKSGRKQSYTVVCDNVQQTDYFKQL